MDGVTAFLGSVVMIVANVCSSFHLSKPPVHIFIREVFKICYDDFQVLVLATVMDMGNVFEMVFVSVKKDALVSIAPQVIFYLIYNSVHISSLVSNCTIYIK